MDLVNNNLHQPSEVGELNFPQLQDWQLVEYSVGADRQLEILGKVDRGELGDQIIFCSHPPVVTLGRFKGASDLLNWEGPVIEASRGGRATYHGPNQLVVYPIINLSKSGRRHLKTRDITSYIQNLAWAIISTVQSYGIDAELKQGTDLDPQGEKRQLTGVWVGERKLASIGVAVKKWISYHGAAINLDNDPLAFQGLNPCGFKSSTMVSLEELLGKPVDRKEFQKRLCDSLRARLN